MTWFVDNWGPMVWYELSSIKVQCGDGYMIAYGPCGPYSYVVLPQ